VTGPPGTRRANPAEPPPGHPCPGPPGPPGSAAPPPRPAPHPGPTPAHQTCGLRHRPSSLSWPHLPAPRRRDTARRYAPQLVPVTLVSAQHRRHAPASPQPGNLPPPRRQLALTLPSRLREAPITDQPGQELRQAQQRRLIAGAVLRAVLSTTVQDVVRPPASSRRSCCSSAPAICSRPPARCWARPSSAPSC